MLCCICKNSNSLLSCSQCEKFYCEECNNEIHLSKFADHKNKMFYLCEECELKLSSLYCKSCEQNLCYECNSRIHNKGKRAEHTRINL